MNELIRGTTPTIKVTFSTVDVANITVAYLIIKQSAVDRVVKELSLATVDENSLSWLLTQTDTLGLTYGVNCEIYCDWKLTDGTRGRSKIPVLAVTNSGKNEVI